MCFATGFGGQPSWFESVNAHRSMGEGDVSRDLLSISLISPLMDPAGAAEQDAPPTGWVEAKIGRTAFLLTLHCAAARGVATGRSLLQKKGWCAVHTIRQLYRNLEGEFYRTGRFTWHSSGVHSRASSVSIDIALRCSAEIGLSELCRRR